MARFTDMNQYEIENAKTWIATQDASPHNRRPRHQPTTSTPTAIETISAANTGGQSGWPALGCVAAMVFRNDSQGGVMVRAQPVDWAWYQAVQLPVSAYR